MTYRPTRLCVCGFEARNATQWYQHRPVCPERPGRQKDGDHRDAIDRLITLNGGDAA